MRKLIVVLLITLSGCCSKVGLSPLANVKYLNENDVSNSQVLELGKNVNWNEPSSISFLPIYAQVILDSTIEMPVEFSENFPSVSDYILGYISIRNGQLTTAESYFKSLEFDPKFSIYADIGRLDMYAYTENIVALCNSVKKHGQSNHFIDKYSKELLIDYKLQCMVRSGEYLAAKAVLDGYHPNDINDRYKKSLVLIDILGVVGKFEEANQAIENTKSWYGITEELIAAETGLVFQMDGYEAAASFLKPYIKDDTFLLKEVYAVDLANSNIDQVEPMLDILKDNASRQPYDIYANLLLAHYSFNYGLRKPLDEANLFLINIKDIAEFSSFNLLEAKMAMLNVSRNYSKTEKKLKKVAGKNPFNESYLWFSYQYNDLIGEHKAAREFLKAYLKIDPHNEIAKEKLQDSEKALGSSVTN